MNARYFSKRVFSTMDKFFDPSKDYYNMLGISQSSSSDQIQKKYFELAKKHHPDRKHGNLKKFLEISDAY